MSKEYILQYIRDLKSVIDYHVTNGIPIGDAVDPELQAVCDKLVQSGTTLEPQFMNEMYKYIIYLENVKTTTDNSDDFLKMTDPKYIKVRNQFQGIHLEFFISMMLMNTTRIILEYENA
jgi:hypothetical protein